MSERLSDQDLVAVLNLLAIEGIGSATVLRAVAALGSIQDVFSASEVRLRSLPRFSTALIERMKGTRADGELGRKQLEEAREEGARIVTFWDSDYPELLRRLENDAPAVLYVRGRMEPLSRRLAVVGTRSATAYGKKMTHDLVAGLRGSGIHIVSGLASGIDGCAHEAALDAGLPTEAVFGCGVDVIYPPSHKGLAEKILESGGGLYSEFPMGAEPDRFHFPQRNRIIAGLCKATLVVEAGARSGALITALLAVEYNRDVFAVPGAVTNPKSQGCHELIKNGAALVEKAEDILDALKLMPASGGKEAGEQMAIRLSEPELNFIRAIPAGAPHHVDVIAERLAIPIGDVLGRLLLLELKGVVRQLPGKYFELA